MDGNGATLLKWTITCYQRDGVFLGCPESIGLLSQWDPLSRRGIPHLWLTLSSKAFKQLTKVTHYSRTFQTVWQQTHIRSSAPRIFSVANKTALCVCEHAHKGTDSMQGTSLACYGWNISLNLSSGQLLQTRKESEPRLITGHFPQKPCWIFLFCVVFQVKSTSIGWSLGYMLTMSNMIPSEMKKTPPMTDSVFAGLVFLFSALTIVTVVLAFIILVRTCFWGAAAKRGGMCHCKAAVTL